MEQLFVVWYYLYRYIWLIYMWLKIFIIGFQPKIIFHQNMIAEFCYILLVFWHFTMRALGSLSLAAFYQRGGVELEIVVF